MAIYRICCIIDLDGFNFRIHHNSNLSSDVFLIREMGLIRVDPEFGDFLSKSYRFDLTFYDFSHCREAWQTINYQSRHVTGLPLKPHPGEKVYQYDLVKPCLLTVYETCRQLGRDVVAYKGGNVEKSILDELGIPNLDLRMYGCPKYEEIIKQEIVRSHIVDCGYHTRISDDINMVHCPKAEVTAFKDWLFLNYPQWDRRGADLPDQCGCSAESSAPSSRADSSSDLSSSG